MVTVRQIRGVSGFFFLIAATLSLIVVPFLMFGAGFERIAVDYFEAPRSRMAYAAFGAAALAADPLLPVPSSVVATLLGLRIGFLPAACANGFGLAVGVVIGLGLGRGGRMILPGVRRPLPPGFEALIRRRGVVALLICRPIPVLAEASLVLAGAAGLRLVPTLAWLVPVQFGLGALYAAAGAMESSSPFPGAALATGAIGIPFAFALLAFVLAGRERREAHSLTQHEA